jgi:hypothetical protein
MGASGSCHPAAPTTLDPNLSPRSLMQPWRLTADSLVDACKSSLSRLQLQQVALYMQHWPGFAVNAWSNDAYLEGLARWELRPGRGLCLRFQRWHRAAADRAAPLHRPAPARAASGRAAAC